MKAIKNIMLSGSRLSMLFICLSCFVLFVDAQTIIYLYTPNGSRVEAQRWAEMSQAEIFQLTSYFANSYPQAQVLANASSTYNCHSYAWNMTEGGTTCWINQDPDLHRYWDDGSYVQTTEQYADKIFYYNGDHSAVSSETHPGKYESKWGSTPLMRHAPGYGPYFQMEKRRYYRKSCFSDLVSQTILRDRIISGCSNDFIVQNVTISAGVNVLIEAPSITLSPNFKAASGSVVSIKPLSQNTTRMSKVISDEEVREESVQRPTQTLDRNNLMQHEYLQITSDSFSGDIILKYNLPFEVNNLAIQIANTTGQVVKLFVLTEKASSSVILNRAEITQGVFICSLVTDGNILASKKLVLAK